MPLTGQAKTDYQREYMRKRRSNTSPVSVRPTQLDPVRPLEPKPVVKPRPYIGELTKAKQTSSKGFNE